MHYTAVLYFKSSNFIIFGNEQNRSESEDPKTKSIGIAYTESKTFQSESVTCLITINFFPLQFLMNKFRFIYA